MKKRKKTRESKRRKKKRKKERVEKESKREKERQTSASMTPLSDMDSLLMDLSHPFWCATRAV